MAPDGGSVEERYRGPLGATRRERVLWACPCGVRHSVEVVVAIDSQADPQLARRLRDGDPAFNDTVCPTTRVRAWVEVPVVYHDPGNQLLILVLPGGARARELEERAALLTRLAQDTAHSVPAYVVGFAVAYGPEGLRQRLEVEAERALDARRRQDATQVSPPPVLGDTIVVPMGPILADSDDTMDDLVEGAPTAPRSPGPAAEEVGRGAIATRSSISCRVEDGVAHIAVRASGADLERLLDPALEVRLQLHRMPNFPIVTLAFGTPAALDGAAGAGAPLWLPLDIGDEADRTLLHSLGRRFEILLEMSDSDSGELVSSVRQSPPLADNVLCALSAAADYLKAIPSAERSYRRGLAAFAAEDHDRLGLSASYAGELDESVLGALASPAEVMRAVNLVKRLSQPSGEDWLVMTRGYPMETWQARRRAVVARAVELGIWPGPVGAQIAVSEGLARSRKDLAVRLQRNFAALVQVEQSTGGLDDAAARDNWKSLRSEARALGLPSAEWALPRSEPIASDAEPVASGTIGLLRDGSEGSGLLAVMTRRRPTTGAEEDVPDVGEDPDVTGTTQVGRGGLAMALEVADLEEPGLIAALSDRDRRLVAALELCRRGQASAVDAVFGALEQFSRAEAGRVMASVAGFGRAAEPHLLAGLRNRKAYLRQGSALALATMKSEAGVEAICDLLLDEPTDIWREVARALGETGVAAVMPLAARLGERPEAVYERAAWALAHIGARGARRPLEALGQGRDPIAAGVARHALELVDLAASDHVAVRGERVPREQTLNRAFSRRFFEAVRAERRAAQAAAAAEAEAEARQGADRAAARAADQTEPTAKVSSTTALAPAGATGVTTGTVVLQSSDLIEVADSDETVEVADAGPDQGDGDVAPS
jgi:hypothetical protein